MIIYQIYPLSFKDTNSDGYGDLPGIISQLDYLYNLGIEAIWLSPIFTSPMKDFGYDISNYYSIDPLFGSMNDFEEFVEKAHSMNIKVLLDYVPNHTSDKHQWFQEAKSSPNHPKHDWYIWKTGKIGAPPNNWISVFGGPAWTYNETTQEWYLHHFLKEQPDLNWRNPEVKKELFHVLEFWIKKGVDGFRIDSISVLV